MVARRLHPMPSTKPRPIDGLEWAMRSEEPATATSRTFSPPTPAIFIYLFICILLGRIYSCPEGKGTRGLQRPLQRCPTSPTPHLHTKDSHSTGITLLFSNSAWVLLRPTELSTFKEYHPTVPRLQQGIHFMASPLQHLQLHLTVSNLPQQEAHLTVSSLQHMLLHLTVPDSPQQKFHLAASSLPLTVCDPPQQEVHLAASTLKQLQLHPTGADS